MVIMLNSSLLKITQGIIMYHTLAPRMSLAYIKAKIRRRKCVRNVHMEMESRRAIGLMICARIYL
jgi:hypothetical protein